MITERHFNICGIRGSCLAEVSGGVLDIWDMTLDSISDSGQAHDLLHKATEDDTVLLDVLQTSACQQAAIDLIREKLKKHELDMRGF